VLIPDFSDEISINDSMFFTMTALQNQKLKMYLAFRELLRTYPAIHMKLPNANELLMELDKAIADIQANSILQQNSSSELKDQYIQFRANVIQDVVDSSRKLQAYATYKKNNALLKDSKYTESELTHMVDVELVKASKAIYNLANMHQGELTSYGLTPETQMKLQNDSTTFETLIPKLAKEKLDQKNVTSALSDNFKTADEIVGVFDTQVEIIRSSDPGFYADYKALRKVYVPTGVMQLVAKIMDAETGAGIPNATVTLTQTDATAEPIVKQTADKGGFQIKSVPNGIYSVTVVKLGYLTQTLNLTLPGDEPYYLEVRMVKNS